jgi:HEAT repeat protein
MRLNQQLPNIFPWWSALVAVAALLSWTGHNPAQQLTPDPVEALRQALRAPTTGEVRDKELAKRVEALRSIPDMRRALMLTEWRADLGAAEAAASPDSKYRTQLVQRAQDAVRQIFRQGKTDERLALMTMLAELGSTTLRGQGSIAGLFAPDLVDLIKQSKDLRVRAAAARTLGRILPDPAVAGPALRGLIRSSTVLERRAAARGVLSMMEVIGSLASQSKDVSGIEILPRDIVAVGSAVADAAGLGLVDADEEVRRLSSQAFALSALALVGQIHQPSAADETATNPEEELRTFREDLQLLPPLIDALVDHAPALTKAIEDPIADVRIRARQTAEIMGYARQRLQREAAGVGQEEAVLPLTGKLLQPLRRAVPALARGVADTNLKARLAAVDALEPLGPEAAPAAAVLIKALADRDGFVRWAAARTLGKTGPVDSGKAVPGLARLLYDEDLQLGAAAAVALERYGPAAKPAVPDLIKILQSKRDEELRASAMRTLQSIGEGAVSAIPALIATLDDPDPRVRQAAAETLGRFGALAAQAKDALRNALSDKTPEVRRAASDAMLNILQAEKK